MARNSNSKNTKEIILDTAFSFLEHPSYSSFSMNELAAKIGLSKPAIYRHFKNKDALIDAMEDLVISNLAQYMKDFDAENLEQTKKSLADLIEYFIENPTHINYLIGQMSSSPNYEEHMFKKMNDFGISFISGKSGKTYAEHFSSDIKVFTQHVFAGMTIFFFVKLQEHLHQLKRLDETPKDFGLKIVNLMIGGLSGSTSSDDAFCPEKISEERKKELFKICEIDSEVFPEENRIFNALATVIEKYKMTGVTVERIADELGMAKSSLYEYFDNKNQMIKTLVNKELQLLQTIIIENSVEAQNFTEYVYVLIASEMAYFVNRPSIIPICGWLLMTNEKIPAKKLEDCENDDEYAPWEKKLPKQVSAPDLGFTYESDVITGWIKCLPVAFLVEAKGKNLSAEKRMEGFMLLIDYILNGIGGNR